MAADRSSMMRWIASALGASLFLNAVLASLFIKSSTRTARPSRAPAAVPSVPGPPTKPPVDANRVVVNGLSGNIRAILRGHPCRVQLVAFSPDSSAVAVATEGGVITVWDLSHGAFRLRSEFDPAGLGLGPERHNFHGLAFSPDSRSLAYSCSSLEGPGTAVRVLDLSTARTRSVFRDDVTPGRQDRSSSGLAFSPDGRVLAVGFRNTVKLFDMETGRFQADLRVEERRYFRSLAFSAGEPRLLATSSLPPPGLLIFDTATGKKTRELKVTKVDGLKVGKHGPSPGPFLIETIALSVDGKRLAAASSDNEVFLWDLTTGENVASIREGVGTGWTEGKCWIGFTPDGSSLLTASRGIEDLGRVFARRRDAATGALLARIELTQPGEPFFYAYPRAFAPNGRVLAGVGEVRSGSHNLDCRESFLVIYDLARLY